MKALSLLSFSCCTILSYTYGAVYETKTVGTGFSYTHSASANANNKVSYSANMATGLSGATSDYVGSYKSGVGAKAVLLKVIDLSGQTYLVLLKDSPEVAPGWAKSSWFGFFAKTTNPSIVYHENLGWLHLSQSEANSAWIYSDEIGWVWTPASHYPAVYMDNWKRWSYVRRPASGVTQLYDYGNNEWFPLGVRYDLSVVSEPSLGGYVFGRGTGSFKRWDSISLTAHPSSGYSFDKWGGGASGDQLQFTTEAIADLSVQAIFAMIPSGNAGGSHLVEAVNVMNHLTETEKRQAIVDLLFSGYSDNASLSLVSEVNTLPKNFDAGSFGNASATLTHDYFPGKLNSRWTYLDTSGKEWHSQATGIEAVHEVQTLRIDNLTPDGASSRWYAQGNAGDLWVLRETFFDGTENDVPWTFLPATPLEHWVVENLSFDGLTTISGIEQDVPFATSSLALEDGKSLEVRYDDGVSQRHDYFSPGFGLTMNGSLELTKYEPGP